MEPSQSSRPDLSALKAAFDAFNEASGQLQNSYEDLQGQVAGLKAQLKIANRERAAEAERNAELAKRLSSLLEALPGGVVMLDESGVVRSVNTAAGDFLGEPLKDHEWTLICRRAFRTDADAQGDLTLQDGRKVSLAQQAMNPGPGRVLLLTDVTENRKLQELLTRHRRLAAMGEMAAALAHQIRTPLSAALLYTSNAATRGLPESRKNELLDKSTRCLQDLEQLITDMLQFARGASFSDGSFAVADLLEAAENALRPTLAANQQLHISSSAPGARITGNREALVGAILNLANNALQHAGTDAQVRIDVATSALQTEIRVSDNGPGVPARHADRIFDPFFTTRPDGTGLGLAVVRSVARAHNGDVTVENGPGACFVLRLPAGNGGLECTAAMTPTTKTEEVAA